MRREKTALILLILSLFLIIGIDVTPFVIKDGEQLLSFKWSYFESVIDALAVCLTYLLLKRELNFRAQILRMAAHDLRNPLGVIRGYAELILEKKTSVENEKHMLERIHAKAGEILELVNDLLDSAVIDQHAVKLERTPTDLDSLASESISEFEAQAKAKRQRLVFVKAGLPARVLADPARLKQVLSNLLSNAIKYSATGSEIKVSSQVSERDVQLRVRDQGPGLSLGESERIFDSFTKVKKRTTGGESSTGLGLSIAKALVKMNGGRIWVESDGEGQGAQFVIEFPRLKE